MKHAPRPERTTITWQPDESDQVAGWRHAHSSGPVVVASMAAIAGLCFWLLPGGALGWTIALSVWLGVCLGGWLAWQIPRQQVRRARLESDRPDAPITLVIDDAGIELTHGSWRRQIAWSGVEAIGAGARHVFLDLADRVVPIPRRILGDASSQASFVAWLGSRRDGGVDRLAGLAPEAGRDQWILRFRLVPDDYVVFARTGHRPGRRQHPLSGALTGALVGGVLLASAEPWRGAVDAGLLALIGSFTVVLIAVGLAPLWIPGLVAPWLVRWRLRRSPWRMPSGEIVLGLGPRGGWLGTHRGVSRFRWSGVRDVRSDADQVSLSFSDRQVVILPSRIFDPPTDQDALVAEIQRWRAPRVPRGLPPGTRRVAPRSGVPDPFAPPASGDPRA